MIVRMVPLAVIVTLLVPLSLQALEPGRGTFAFEPKDGKKAGVAERFQMPARTFAYTLTLRHELKSSGVRVFDLTFPSAIESDVPENNTVHCELFLPAGKGPFPAVVALDILQGNAIIARGKCLWLAQNGIAGMVVYMAHYGPRRPPNSPNRLLSPDISKTIDGVRQTILDVRCAVAWLASRPEFDANNLGIVGTSLGSMVGAIAAANEPRIKNVCLMLTGGGLVEAYYHHPQAAPYLAFMELVGGRPVVEMLIGSIDPITYAKHLKTKNLLMICASRDDIVPPSAAKALWEATGKQKIIWIDATHVGAAAFTMPLLRDMTAHLRGKK